MSINVASSEWRLTTDNGIPYKLVSLKGNFNAEEATATEVVLVQSSRLLAFAAECLPLPVSLSGDQLTFNGPRNLPGFPALLCKQISWQGFPGAKPNDPFSSDSGAPSGTYESTTEVTIEYSSNMGEGQKPGDPSDPATFLEITSSAAVKVVGVPLAGSTAYWGDAAGANLQTEVREANVNQTLIEPEVDWSVKWTLIPVAFFNSYLIGEMRSKIGKVNSVAMTLLHNAPAETILFQGYSYRRLFNWQWGVTADGSPGSVVTPSIECDLKFTERNFQSAEGISVTHQHIYRPNVGYRKIQINGNLLYGTVSLDDIFAPLQAL